MQVHCCAMQEALPGHRGERVEAVKESTKKAIRQPLERGKHIYKKESGHMGKPSKEIGGRASQDMGNGENSLGVELRKEPVFGTPPMPADPQFG